MKLRICLVLGLWVTAVANGADVTNRALPSPQSLQTNVLTETPGNRWSATWTNLTVKKGGCPPWGCVFEYVRWSEPGDEKHIEAMLELRTRLRETEIPRLRPLPSFSESFSVSPSHVTNDFRTLQEIPKR